MKQRHCTEFLPFWAGRILAVAVGLALPRNLWAQSCALCYQAAASAGARFIDALRSGIVILMMAPVAICTGFAIAAYRKRNLCADEDGSGMPETMEVTSAEISWTGQATCKSE